MAEFKIVGKPIPQFDAFDKIQGITRFAADYSMPGMLWGGVLRSQFASAEILSIDVKNTKSIAGVKAVLTAHDIPGKNIYHSPFRSDHPVLVEKMVRFIGNAIALVAAATPEIMKEALDAINVTYIEIEGVYDPIQGLDSASFQLDNKGNVVCEHHISKGDVEKGFSEAAVVVEKT